MPSLGTNSVEAGFCNCTRNYTNKCLLQMHSNFRLKSITLLSRSWEQRFRMLTLATEASSLAARPPLTMPLAFKDWLLRRSWRSLALASASLWSALKHSEVYKGLSLVVTLLQSYLLGPWLLLDFSKRKGLASKTRTSFYRSFVGEPIPKKSHYLQEAAGVTSA